MSTHDYREYRGKLAADPYRYICPDCGSHGVRELMTMSRPDGKTYAANGRGQSEARRDAQKRYACQSCGERKSHVLDKKQPAAANGGEAQ